MPDSAAVASGRFGVRLALEVRHEREPALIRLGVNPEVDAIEIGAVSLGGGLRARARLELIHVPTAADAVVSIAELVARWQSEEWASAVTPLIARVTPADADADAVIDAKVIYQESFDEVEQLASPELFLPKTGPLGLMDWEKVYSAAPNAWCRTDIFDECELSRDGVVVVVRPDQYVAAVLPLDGVAALESFLDGVFLPA